MNDLGIIFFLKTLLKQKKIAFRKTPLILGLLLKFTTSAPFALYERLFARKSIDDCTIKEPPIFILGHYRSGTTFLFKLLSLNPNWCTPRIFDLIFPYQPVGWSNFTIRILNPLLKLIQIHNPFFNNQILNLEDPAEDELCLTLMGSSYAAYWGYLFPLNYAFHFNKSLRLEDHKTKECWKRQYLFFTKRMVKRNKGKRIVFKSPTNTARIKTLLELFPDSKFIFIHRNPYEVFYSTKKLWETTILPAFSLQSLSEQAISDNIFAQYLLMHEAYEKNKGSIPEENLVEIDYQSLITDPANTILELYNHLNFKTYPQFSKDLAKFTKKEQSYQKSKYEYHPSTLDSIKQKLEHWIDLWHYRVPD